MELHHAIVITGPDLVLYASEGAFAFAIFFTATLVVVGGGACRSGRVLSVSRQQFVGRGQLGDLSLECDDFSFFGRRLVPGFLCLERASSAVVE